MQCYQISEAGRVFLREVAEPGEVDSLFTKIRLLILEHERILENNAGHVLNEELHAMLGLQVDRVQRAVDQLRRCTEPKENGLRPPNC